MIVAPLTGDRRALVEDLTRRYRRLSYLAQRAAPDAFRALTLRCPPEDIEQMCWVGACKAACRFDFARGLAFDTYAAYWVEAAVRGALSRLSAAKRQAPTASGDTPVGDTGGPLWDALGHLAPAAAGPDPARGCEVAELRAALADALSLLPTRDRQVLELRYGLTDGVQRTLKETGAELGVSRERVRQLEARAFERIRIPLQLAGVGHAA